MIAKILAGALAITLLFGWYFKYTNDKKMDFLVKNNAVLVANEGVLREVNTSNTETIEELVASQEEVARNFDKLQDEMQLIRSQRDELVEKYESNNLEYLATMKPELVERIINRASVAAGRCFELLSGAPLNTREISAQNSREFNSECPWLYGELK